MKVLYTNHFPFQGSATGMRTLELGHRLHQGGDEIQTLIVDVCKSQSDPIATTRVICNPEDPDADLLFNLPSFTTHPTSHLTFSDLSDDQVAEYRDILRRKLDEVICGLDPDIVHCQHAWILSTLVLESGVPYVLSIVETNLLAFLKDDRFRLLSAQAAENAGRVITHSQYTANKVAELMDVEEERIIILPGAADCDKFGNPKLNRTQAVQQLGLEDTNGPLMVCAGKMIDLQGIDVLLDAAQRYEEELPDSLTIIVGEGPLKEQLIEQTQKLGLKRTHFFGNRDKIDIASLYAAADLMILPIRCEPFEYVIQQSLAAGTPVIISDLSGNSELINESVGGLVPVDNSTALSDMVIQAIKEHWKESKGPAAKELANTKHNLNDWISKVREIYEHVRSERFGEFS